MSTNEFLCPKCKEKAFPIKIEQNPKDQLFILTLKCPDHNFKLKLSDDELKPYLNAIYKSTLFCQYCGATIPNYRELNSYISTIGMGSRGTLVLKKKCENCGKKTVFEFINLLYKSFYDINYNFLKSQVSEETYQKYQNGLLCPQCNSPVIANSVMNKEGVYIIAGKCRGSSPHMIEFNLPYLDQYVWLSLLPESIDICKNCNSTDLVLKKLDFKVKMGGTHGYMNKRAIVKICNKCNYENVTIMHQSLYETYRRILKEKTAPVNGKGSLICPKCNSEALLENVDLKPHEIQVQLFCKQRHRTITALKQDDKLVWINDLLSGVNICSKCWSSNQKIWAIKPMPEPGSYDKIRKTWITLYCGDCKNKRSVKINNVVFDEVMDFLLK